MAIEDILSRIERENREKVSSIIGKAESKADEIKEDYSRKADKLRGELDEKFRRKADEHRRQIVVSERLDLRKKLLSEKRDILEEFYGKARDKISSMSGEEYAGFIRKLILKRAVTGKEEIVIPAAHRDIFTGEFVSSLNDEFGGGSFSVSPGEGDLTWGVILRQKDRLIDLSLESFLRELIDRTEPEAARILFSEGDGEVE
ncbi:MAG: V-type ATP synthase subunit E family protein [Candidatus Krumholzibacteriales bacterium]